MAPKLTPANKRPRTASTPDSSLNKQDMKDLLNEILDTKLEPIYERLDSIEGWVKSYKNEIQILQKQLDDRESKISMLESELNVVKKRQIALESHSRRSNLKIFGIPESKGEIIECKLDQFFFESGLEIDCHALDRAHRLGPFKSGQKQPRPVIIKFIRSVDREYIWRTANKRPGRGIYVQEDFPIEIENNRRRLLPVYHAIQAVRNTDGSPKYYAKLSADRLIVNKQVYSVDSLEDLPSPIKPSMLFTPSNDVQVSFFSPNSPLSNMHPSPFTQDGEVFTCMEQYMVTKKAQLFDDQRVVVEVAKERDPFKQKQIGKQVENFDQSKWEGDALNLILPGVIAKFEQNELCKKALLATGNKSIVEANPYDNFWGAALSLRDTNLWNPEKMVGRNEMGKLLMKVRELLKLN